MSTGAPKTSSRHCGGFLSATRNATRFYLWSGIVLLGSVLLGVGFATTHINRKKPIQKEEYVDVLVARQDIEIGYWLHRAKWRFEKRRMPISEAPKHRLASFEPIENHFVNREIKKGDVISLSDVVAEIESVRFTGSRKPVRVRGVFVFEGGYASLSPDIRFNLAAYIRDSKSKKVVAYFITNHVRVLSINANNKQKDLDSLGRHEIVEWLVVLTPQEAESARAAESNGKIRFILSRRDDPSVPCEVVNSSLRSLKKELQKKGQ